MSVQQSSRQLINLIDVGAVGGLEYPWSKREELLGTVLSFEPNESEVWLPKRIKLDTAVWNEDGEATLRVYGRGGVGSSLLTQNETWVAEHFDEIAHLGDPRMARTWSARAVERARAQIKTERLDSILARIRAQRPNIPGRFHFLKSDTQSGEFFVVDGAREFLRSEAIGVELELFRYPLYEGIHLEDEMIDLMNELGFEVAGWTGYKATFLSQADYLFIKRDLRTEEERSAADQIRALYGGYGPDSIIKQMPLHARLEYKARRAVQLLRSVIRP